MSRSSQPSRIVVTGAAGGIGGATVGALRARGAEVVGLDLRADDDLGIVACDVRHQSSVDAAITLAVRRLGGIDVLVNNAGIGDANAAGEPPDAAALAVLDVNLVGPWRVTSAALPALRAARGRVVNVASGLAFLTLPFAAAYCASKRGLVAYSDALRLEHGDAITVTTIYPGYVRTAIHDAPAKRGYALEGAVPAERLDDVARTMVRACLGRPARDLATTRSGWIAHAALRHIPPSLVDRAVLGRARRLALRGGSLPGFRGTVPRR